MLLVGCGRKKRAEPAAASELYTGSLCKARIHYAEASGCPWYIVSARYGLVEPDVELRPYNTRLTDHCEPERAAWALSVVHEVLDRLPDEARLSCVTLELHAGEDYATPLERVAEAVGFKTASPLRGLGIGQQLGWYAARRASE